MDNLLNRKNKVLLNSKLVNRENALISIHNRAVEFSDSLYEVIKVKNSTLLFLDLHMERLAMGMAFLYFPHIDTNEIKEEIKKLVDTNGLINGIVYLQVSRGENPREHIPPVNIRPTYWAYTKIMEFPTVSERIKGVKIVSHPDIRWKIPSIKTTNLLPNIIARRKAADQGAKEALLYGKDGTIHECTSSNIFFIKSNTVITPILEEQILSGITRRTMIEMLLDNQFSVKEERISISDIVTMDEAFLTATTYDIMPIGSIDGHKLRSSAKGAITLSIIQMFEEKMLSLTS